MVAPDTIEPDEKLVQLYDLSQKVRTMLLHARFMLVKEMEAALNGEEEPVDYLNQLSVQYARMWELFELCSSGDSVLAQAQQNQPEISRRIMANADLLLQQHRQFGRDSMQKLLGMRQAADGFEIDGETTEEALHLAENYGMQAGEAICIGQLLYAYFPSLHQRWVDGLPS